MAWDRITVYVEKAGDAKSKISIRVGLRGDEKTSRDLLAGIKSNL